MFKRSHRICPETRLGYFFTHEQFEHMICSELDEQVKHEDIALTRDTLILPAATAELLDSSDEAILQQIDLAWT
jgi:hypothetical protein